MDYMIYIKKIHIEGFKKFDSIEIVFNESKNLLVGDNGSGKSTVLEAINLALNHSINKFDLSLLKVMFNIDNVKRFEEARSVSSLPRILIQIFFGGTDDNPNYQQFYGPYYEKSDNKEDFGVEFKAELDKSLITELSEQISNGYIPYEYYQLTSITFANSLYRPGISNISFCLINTSNSSIYGINNYSKMMFKALLQEQQLKLKNKFSIELDQAMQETMKLLPDGAPKFSYNVEKASLETIVEIHKNNLPLSSLGQGNESIIKTQNLIKHHGKATIIGIEEPENHLSYSSMNQMIQIIQSENINKQLIITSHSNRITSGIGLNNVIGLSNKTNDVMSLKNLNKETYEYFEVLPSDSLLQFILSKKVILVEGPAEQIYMPIFYSKETNGKKMEEKGISCISVNGLSFKHFIYIAKSMGIKICVITDNDNDLDKVEKFKKDLKQIYDSEKFEVYTDNNSSRRTFEICLYEDNKELIQKEIKLQDGALYSHKYDNNDRYLGKMLNDKTGTALELTKNSAFVKDCVVPNYIKSAIEFIKNE